MADPETPVMEEAARHHLARVLRLRAGEAVVATDGRGRWRWCRYADGALEPDGPLEEDGDNGDLTARQLGKVGGNMVKRLVERGEQALTEDAEQDGTAD